MNIVDPNREKVALSLALLGILAALGCTGVASIGIKAYSKQAAASLFQPPSTSKDQVAEGHRLFELSCAGCHGDDASGDEGPDLRKLPISNAHITLVVHSGIQGEMPSFAKIYAQPQTDAIISFLRSLK